MPPSKVALFDVGLIFRRYWHAAAEDSLNAAREHTLAYVAQHASGYDLVGVCADRPPYKRREIFPAYKAHRDAPDVGLIDQLARTLADLDAWGYRVIGVDGYEADDVIATLVRVAVEDGHEVDVYSSDKDLAQVLLHQGTQLIQPHTGAALKPGSPEWAKRFGGHVSPRQIPSWIALVGDKSDNLPGLERVGPKTAAKWLGYYGDVDTILGSYDDSDDPDNGPLTDKQRELLSSPEIQERLREMVKLATCCETLDLTVADLQSPRTPPAETTTEDQTEDTTVHTREDLRAIYVELAKPFPDTAVERTKAAVTRKGYDTTGIKYQYIVNRLNEVLGVGCFRVTREFSTREKQTRSGYPMVEATCDLTMQLGQWVDGEFAPFAEAVGTGGHASNNEADAKKGAFTNGFKKVAAFFGVGWQAYAGTIDDDNAPAEEPSWSAPSHESPPFAGDAQQQMASEALGAALAMIGNARTATELRSVSDRIKALGLDGRDRNIAAGKYSERLQELSEVST
jgi:5'-3' exonuclease